MVFTFLYNDVTKRTTFFIINFICHNTRNHQKREKKSGSNKAEVFQEYYMSS